MPKITIARTLTSLVAVIGLVLASLITSALVNSLNKKSAADGVARSAALSLNLFQSLSQMRNERGYGFIALNLEPSANRSAREYTLAARAPVDRALDAAAQGLAASFKPELQALAGEIAPLVATFRQMRSEIDASIDGPLGGRNPDLKKRMFDLGGRIIERVERSARIVDFEIKALDPSTAPMLNARANAWATRDATGELGTAVNVVIGSRQPATDAQRNVIHDAEVRARTLWAVVGRTAEEPGRSPTVTQAYKRGSEAYFGGSFDAMRQDLVRRIAAGDALDFPVDTWMKGNYTAMSAIVDTAAEIMSELAAGAQRHAEREQSNFLFYLAVAAFGLVLIVASVLIVQLRVVRGITTLAAGMRDIAAGNTEVAVPLAGRGDELGSMASAVQVFKDNLIRTREIEAATAQARASAEEQRKATMHAMADAFEGAVGDILATVSSSATELQATAKSMTATATQTAVQSTSVAAAAEEAGTNVGAVAAAAEELGASVQEIARQVDGSAGLARDAVSEADETGRLVQELSQAVSRIGDVVGLISTIAGQTNLLALNATIEAARAGEAGRGFAVVATEVKELAGQTARATQEITLHIQRIQASTDQAVSAIGVTAARIREIDNVAASIAAAVEEQGAATQEIVRNVSQAAMGTGEVTVSIACVAGAAEETGTAASQVLGAASDLSQQSAHLTREVTRFLDTVRAA